MVVDIFDFQWVVVDRGGYILAHVWWWWVVLDMLWLGVGGGGWLWVVVDIFWLMVGSGGYILIGGGYNLAGGR